MHTVTLINSNQVFQRGGNTAVDLCHQFGLLDIQSRDVVNDRLKIYAHCVLQELIDILQRNKQTLFINSDDKGDQFCSWANVNQNRVDAMNNRLVKLLGSKIVNSKIQYSNGQCISLAQLPGELKEHLHIAYARNNNTVRTLKKFSRDNGLDHLLHRLGNDINVVASVA